MGKRQKEKKKAGTCGTKKLLTAPTLLEMAGNNRQSGTLRGADSQIRANSRELTEIDTYVLLVIPKAAYHPRSAQAAPRLLN